MGSPTCDGKTMIKKIRKRRKNNGTSYEFTIRCCRPDIQSLVSTNEGRVRRVSLIGLPLKLAHFHCVGDDGVTSKHRRRPFWYANWVVCAYNYEDLHIKRIVFRHKPERNISMQGNARKVRPS